MSFASKGSSVTGPVLPFCRACTSHQGVHPCGRSVSVVTVAAWGQDSSAVQFAHVTPIVAAWVEKSVYAPLRIMNDRGSTQPLAVSARFVFKLRTTFAIASFVEFQQQVRLCSYCSSAKA